MLDEQTIRELLQPFGLKLNSFQVGQLGAYLNLLMRWNAKINLTSIQRPEECVTRHFGESLFIANHESLGGPLLDIGSGAGFPGLALKIIFPELAVTLLEPVAKKRAFLKEAVRECGFDGVEVRSERLEELQGQIQRFAVITARAVGHLEDLVARASELLKGSGKLYLWLSKTQADELKAKLRCVQWLQKFEMPLSRDRVVLVGFRE